MPLGWAFPSLQTAVLLWDDHTRDKKHAQVHCCGYLPTLRAARAIRAMASKLIGIVLPQALIPKPRL